MSNIVKDKEILRRIGCVYGDGTYAMVDDTASNSAIGVSSADDIDDIVIDDSQDNLDCDADFDCVDDGYNGQDGFMKGAITKFRKNGKYPEQIGIYSADGMYEMESGRGVTAYLGKNGRAQCIAIPQCKMMNSTVLDGEWVKHPVYVTECQDPYHTKHLDVYNGSELSTDIDKSNEWLWNGCDSYYWIRGTHVPFDTWCVMGAIFGKALRIWRGVAKMDMKKMPCWMYVSIQEMFEALNPGSRWCDLSKQSKYRWQHDLVETFKYMRFTSLAWDLPVDGGGRNTYCMYSILESTWVRKRVERKDEAWCKAMWNGCYEPCGFKVRLRGNAIFDFCWRRGNSSPSVVQIRRYEHDASKVLGMRGWTRCFHLIWASWLVQYRNYWKRRGGGYDSCVLEWSQKEMLKGFDRSIFKIAHLSTEEMVQVLEYHTQNYVASHKERRPAHCASVEVLKRCVVGWTMPKSLCGENVIVKDVDGVNRSIEDAGIIDVPDDVELAMSRMKEINEENMRHVVTVHGRRVDVHESVIYRYETDDNGAHGVWDRNGRNYSMKNGIQALKRTERGDVLIDGQRTCEVDYSALHPHMLYAMNGLDFHGDVYNVGNWYQQYGLTKEEARKACKKMMLITINARNKVVAMHSFKKEWNLDNGLPAGTFISWMYVLYGAIMRRHRRIAHEFCSGKGVYLMNMDGRLMREVMHRLARRRICALGVHDSVVVNARFASVAAGIMKEEYAKMFNGKDITVKY